MKAVFLALAIASAGLGAAAQSPPEPAPLGPAVEPPKAVCFFTRDLRSQTVGGDHTIYFNVRGRDTYRVDVAGNCLAAATSADRVVVSTRGVGGQVCDKMDLEISVHGSRCMVENIAKMTPAEVAAMPRHSDPQDLFPTFGPPGLHLPGRPQL